MGHGKCLSGHYDHSTVIGFSAEVPVVRNHHSIVILLLSACVECRMVYSLSFFVPLYNDEVIEATSSHRYEDGRLATNTHATDIATEERSTLTEYNT